MFRDSLAFAFFFFNIFDLYTCILFTNSVFSQQGV